MFHYSYNTSTFSNKEHGTDRAAQRKALVAKLHHEFDVKLNKVQQHIADINHRSKQCGIYNDFVYIIKENSPPSHLNLTDPKDFPMGTKSRSIRSRQPIRRPFKSHFGKCAASL
jgi:hypothetical protein